MPEEIIHWSARANHSATKLAKWLGENYGPDYAERYMNAMLRVIENVAKHPTKGLVVRTGEVRRWKLNKHNYMLYSMIPGGIMVKDILPYKRLRKGFV